MIPRISKNFLFILIIKGGVKLISGAKLQMCLYGSFLRTFDRLRPILCYKMLSKNNGFSVSPGTVLSVVCLLLYSAGFIRIELKFDDHDQRLMAVEEVISQMKHGMAVTWNKGKVLARRVIFLFCNSFLDCI